MDTVWIVHSVYEDFGWHSSTHSIHASQHSAMCEARRLGQPILLGEDENDGRYDRYLTITEWVVQS